MAAYGSGHFGRWITDEAGLPAYEYTCNHLQDPAAEYTTRHGKSRDHFHLLGNYRASALAHNEGYVELFRPDTVGSWLNRYAPTRQAYAGGFGFIKVEREVRSTLYRHLGGPFYRRVWGVGYFRRSAAWGNLAVEQIAFMPYGHDPVLINLTTLSNRGLRPLTLSYVEYWDVLLSPVLPGHGETGRIVSGLRVPMCTRYDERRRLLLASPRGPFPGPGAPADRRDPDPPTVFLAAIDGQAVAAVETSRVAFFGEGGLDAPSALTRPFLGGHTYPRPTRGTSILFAMQRNVAVPPGGRVTLGHLYGYGSWDSGRRGAHGSATPAGLVERYSLRSPRAWFEQSLESWRQGLIHFEAPEDAWLAREAAWNSYYGQALASYSAQTDETYFDQGGCCTYELGGRSPVRDCCRHALALLPNNPEQVRGTIRHIVRLAGCEDAPQQPPALGPLRSLLSSGPSDLQLWLLWLIADYALYYRDRAFMDQEVALQPRGAGRGTSIRRQVRLGLDHVFRTVGRGKNGLLRLLGEDGGLSTAAGGPLGLWWLRSQGESTFNSALAATVMPRVAELCRWLGEEAWAAEVEQWTAENRQALGEAWNRRWYDRVLTPRGVALGREHLYVDCQPWTIVGGVASEARQTIVLHEIKTLLEEGPASRLRGLTPVGCEHAAPGAMAFAVSGPLVWALAYEDPVAAWERLRSCTLASHAEAAPQRWYGIWSGPGALPAGEGPGPRCDFPIADGHSANQLLFVLARLAGLEADAGGYSVHPRLPFSSFAFEAARFGVRWAERKVSGYVLPQGNDAAQVRVQFAQPFARVPRVTVDRRRVPAELSEDRCRVAFPVFFRGGHRTEWEITPEAET